MRDVPIQSTQRLPQISPMEINNTCARQHALRKFRISNEGSIYLLTCVTRGRRKVFSDFSYACIASRIIGSPKYWRNSKALAWVLMPDHWHALVQVGGDGSLGRLVQRINSAISRSLNRSMASNGRIWQGAYHDHMIRNDENLRNAARYLIQNPLRAGLCDQVGKYSFWNAVWIEDVYFDPDA
jgi:putative transposase